jgi:hypothetical protein
MSENLKRMLQHQKQAEDKEMENLIKQKFGSYNKKTKLAIELHRFLLEELPNTEGDMARLHLYQLSPELRRKFTIRCLEKGLIKV